MDTSPFLTLPVAAIMAFAAILGACIGSFLTLVTYRLPRDEKIGMTRSRCPSCSQSLRARDLVPVLSWVCSGGKCRYCKTKVSPRYPITEFACAIGGIFAVFYWGLSWQALGMAGLWWSIVAIIITDLEHTIILDEVQIAIAIFGVIYNLAIDIVLLDMAIGALWGLAIGLILKYGFLYFRNKDGLGLGDVKFLAAAGVWLASGVAFVPFLFISGVLGIVSGTAWRLAGKGERFPFGPALAASLLLGIVVPKSFDGFWTLYGLLH